MKYILIFIILIFVLTCSSQTLVRGPATVTLPAGTTFSVDLSWVAPVNSPDPIVGYNAYRTIDGQNTYQLLNVNVDPNVTYVDSLVTNGTVYDYIVESVDANSNKSVPTSPVTVTIPSVPSGITTLAISY